MADDLAGPFGVIFLLFGLVFLGIGVYQVVVQEMNLWTYEETEGTVVHSSMKKEYHASVGGHSAGVSFVPKIEYRYAVGGQTYNGSRLSPGGSLLHVPPFSSGLVDKYPRGANVTVHYQPGNPDTAFLLDRRAVLGPLLLFGFGGVVSGIGAFFLVGEVDVVFVPD